MGEVGLGHRAKPGQQLIQTPINVLAAATQLIAAGTNPLRVSVEIQNKSMNLVHVGTTNGVLAANGIALIAASAANAGDGGVIQLDVSPEEALWAIAAAAPSRVLVSELIGV